MLYQKVALPMTQPCCPFTGTAYSSRCAGLRVTPSAMGELCHMSASEPRAPPSVTFGDRVFPEVTEVTKGHWLGPIPV